MNEVLFLFYAVLIIANFKLLIQLSLSIIYNLKRKKISQETFPRISIIVPAFNEEKTIQQCIKSLSNIDYPNYEIIIVDDGSTDQTLLKASQCACAKVLHQENGGKPNALNNGIRHSSGQIILTVDADTTLDNQALRVMAARFDSNPLLGAVAGNVKVKQEPKILNAVQSAEYATGINLVRKGQSVLGCVMIVPGPVAALRREAVERAGLFASDTFAEDFDITLNIIKKGYKIEYEEKSLAYTDAPKNAEDLIKQRRRWYRGMIQVLDKHSRMYFNPKYGVAGVFGVPNLWLDAISPFLNLSLLLITLLTWTLTKEVFVSIIGIAIYLGFSLGINIIALSIEPKPERRNYFVLPLLLFYNTFLDGIRTMSLIEETVNTVMEWEKPKR
jgi:poly-beta-1,6-N-acetyl-D-glucosamine synthase